MVAFDELPAKTQRNWWIAFGVAVVIVGGVVAWMLWPAGSNDPGRDDQATEESQAPDPADSRPELPDEAREKSKAGIKATVRYRYELLNYANVSRDFDATNVVEDEACEFCTSFRASRPDVLPDGRSIRGGRYSVTSFRDTTFSQPHDSDLTGVVIADIAYEEGEVIDSKGDVVKSLPSGNTSVRFALRYEPGVNHWLITYVEAVS